MKWKYKHFSEWKKLLFPCSIKGCDSVYTLLSVKQTQEVFTFTKAYLQRHSSMGKLDGIGA